MTERRRQDPRDKPTEEQVAWHHLEMEEVRQRLDANLRDGLSSEQVRQRQERYGLNRLTRQKRRSELVRFLLQFHSPLLYILLAAALVTALLQEWVDAFVVFAVVLVNAIVGYVQEAKAEKAVEALASMVRTEATVRRDGRKQRIPSAELVPGDVVLLQSGDGVPADMRLFDLRSLQIEEASLTGESVPAQKAVEPLPVDTGLGDRRNLAFAGTFVTYGQGEGVVWATGDHTEVGHIATMISEVVDLSTPLTRKIAEFSRLLLYVILGLAALTFLVGVLRGEHAAEMFMAAVALAVGAIPEGLPAAVTITLAIGVSRMARRRAIIRKMPAVETLGSTTVICSDKTGTLTENQMTVSRIWAGGQVLEVIGGGYEPHGDIRRDSRKVTPTDNPALGECLRAGLLCNDSQLVRKEGRLQVEGDPTEAALIVAAQKAGLEAKEAASRWPRADVIPFESERMFMATLHRDEQGGVIYKKGSVERVADRCDKILDAAGREVVLEPASVHAAAEEMAAQGLRVLAFARRRVPADHVRLSEKDVAGGFTLLGLQGMIDPPRAEAIRAVGDCQKAGIEVKMITGDHKGTAVAVAEQLGLRGGQGSTGRLLAVTGRELEQIPDDKLPETVERAAVFARVAPEQKLRLVRALQSRGHIVAMTGDGVNDAPALKQADIGVAMGITGTDVSKGAADMILADDNFASIEAAVEEGRNVFDNLTKFIAWTMPTNGGEGLLILLAILLGVALPALPVQFLWINMTTALLLGLMLVFEPKEQGTMARPPRDPAQPILTPALLLRILIVSLLMLAGGFALFVWEGTQGASLAESRTAVVNVIVMVETFYLLNCRSLTRPFFSLGLFTNLWVIAGVVAMIVAQLLFTYAPFMHRLFHSAPISGAAWLRIIGIGLVVFTVVELKKWLDARRSMTLS
ncbi:MAG: cation-transporting P-type ATPase [Planctomycetes bacterium]|jgi:magnesium-transporting ATPase (P-type)|nr:cation-transporting P-type ATPase [Planctomycetota bacterium]